MTDRHDMTARHTGADGKPQWAVFLPAISSAYSIYIGKQRFDPQYVPPARMPTAIPDMEQLNFLNDQKGEFHYRWALYSAGHADLNIAKPSARDDMVRTRNPNTIVLGDSGGFQIAKGVWEGDWKNPNDPKSSKKREQVLVWLDSISDYAMILDIPAWIVRDPEASRKSGIYTYQDAVDATQYNNEYFIKHRKGWQEGGTKFLNVLQGSNHTESDAWYEQMKKYNDPAQYPGRHFNGWAMGGQNMCDLHLMLRRLIIMIDDGLLEQGIHDWIHVLGTSKLEWAVVLTAIQTAIRKYHNPDVTVSFDCASPFLATANGQVYYTNSLPDRGRWSYQMEATADNKKYAADQRAYRDAVLQDKIHKTFSESPVTRKLTVSDVCCYAPGMLNKIGKEGKTSWDSFSYVLLMVHNVWMHIDAVQTANELHAQGIYPKMLVDEQFQRVVITDVIDQIFAQNDRQKSLDLLDYHYRLWTNMIGGRGFTGKRAVNAHTQFNALFDVDDVDDNEDALDESRLDELEHIAEEEE